ncbi:MAG: hypothetical protein Q9213_006228 [Squamulea squamosa]
MQLTYYPAGSKTASQSPLPRAQITMVTKLDKLPLELLEMILLQVHDLQDLYSLVVSCPRAQDLYLSDPQDVVMEVLSKNNQLRSRVLGNQDLNEGHQYLRQPTIDHLLNKLLETEDQDIENSLSILFKTMGPMGLLQEAASNTRNIAEAEESLISTMLSKANVEREGAMRTRQHRDAAIQQDKMKKARVDKAYLATFSSLSIPTTRTLRSMAGKSRSPYTFRRLPPSATELHRIRRAFWRLWLFFELYHHPGLPPGRPYDLVSQRTGNRYFSAVDFFFNPLALWELEEMECAYYHLRRQSHLWRRKCPHCWKYFLPDILTKHLYECEWLPAPEEPLPSMQQVNQPYRGITLRLFDDANQEQRWRKWDMEEAGLEGMSRTTTPTGDGTPDTEMVNTLVILSDEPSAGWSFVNQNQSVLNMYEGSWQRRRKPMGCFLDWGYCMWDLGRLQAWHLIDDPENGIEAEPEWWTDGMDRQEMCDHCRGPPKTSYMRKLGTFVLMV